MASLQINNPQLQAAQSKLAIAQFIGDGSMWEQAMSSLKSAYEAKSMPKTACFRVT
jgi:predicted metal-dependent hydrolase